MGAVARRSGDPPTQIRDHTVSFNLAIPEPIDIKLCRGLGDPTKHLFYVKNKHKHE